MLQKTVKLGMRAMPGKDGIIKSKGLIIGRGLGFRAFGGEVEVLGSTD